MTIHTQLTLSAYRSFLFRQSYRNPFVLYVMAGTAIGLTLVLLQVFGVMMIFPNGVAAPLFMSLAILLVSPVTIYWSAGRNYRSNQRLAERMTYTFTEDDIHIQGDSFSTQMSWNKVHKVALLGNWVLIYSSRQVANIISVSDFGSHIDEFSALVKRKGLVKGKSRGPAVVAIISIILLGGSLAFMALLRTAPETYNIPAGYEGPVLVVFDQAAGAPVVLEDGRRVYNIAENGLLFTQSVWNSGLGSDQKFYSIRGGQHTPLTLLPDAYRYHPGDADSDQIGVLFQGSYYGKERLGDRSLIRASTFAVGRHKMLNYYDTAPVADSIEGAQLAERAFGK